MDIRCGSGDDDGPVLKKCWGVVERKKRVWRKK